MRQNIINQKKQHYKSLPLKADVLDKTYVTMENWCLRGMPEFASNSYIKHVLKYYKPLHLTPGLRC